MLYQKLAHKLCSSGYDGYCGWFDSYGVRNCEHRPLLGHPRRRMQLRCCLRICLPSTRPTSDRVLGLNDLPTASRRPAHRRHCEMVQRHPTARSIDPASSDSWALSGIFGTLISDHISNHRLDDDVRCFITILPYEAMHCRHSVLQRHRRAGTQ